MRRPRIIVEIGTLALDGFDERQCRTLADALERALTLRLAAGPARAYRNAAVDSLVARPLEVNACNAPAALGGALAERVWRSIGETQAKPAAHAGFTPDRRR
ncbi:hypothetical protein PTKU64_80330 [Paraburkholderia terrae]|uniref:Uncharacterized protein n=1 Tax=Paraburkholderia terrae TaxID=311230 RepID=A0ABM7U010_9BURK|nr:hypothetical protein [Paraburkholderia terrae]BCZ84358.1 hypothetical protein PTKU64_80330 [Paraburkholderia terrae]